MVGIPPAPRFHDSALTFANWRPIILASRTITRLSIWVPRCFNDAAFLFLEAVMNSPENRLLEIIRG